MLLIGRKNTEEKFVPEYRDDIMHRFKNGQYAAVADC